MLRFRFTNNYTQGLFVDTISVRSSNVLNHMNYTYEKTPVTSKSQTFHTDKKDFVRDQYDRGDMAGVRRSAGGITAGTAQGVPVGGVIDMYMLVSDWKLVDKTDNFIINISYSTGVPGPYVKRKHEIIIPRSSVPFLKEEFEPGKRYLFNVSLDPSKENITRTYNYTPANSGTTTLGLLTSGSAILSERQNIAYDFNIDNHTGRVRKIFLNNTTTSPSPSVSIIPDIYFHESVYYTITSIASSANAASDGEYISTIHVPNSVKTIGSKALRNQILERVYLHCNTPPLLGFGAFDNLRNATAWPSAGGECIIHIPQNAIAAYQDVLNSQKNGWIHSTGTISISTTTPVELINFTGLLRAPSSLKVATMKIVSILKASLLCELPEQSAGS